MSVQIYVGDCRDVLRTLADESVQCCITSPPYWGLRDYGTEPQVWGGDVDCEHAWGKEKVVNVGNNPSSRSTLYSPGELNPGQAAQDYGTKTESTSSQGAFCQLCGAWRGSLGLEPTPELYVQHLVEIFREVRRVLCDDGTLWLNLGDSYASQPSWGRGGGSTLDGGIPHPAGVQRNLTDLKLKDLVGIPWRVAFTLQADGWWLRSDIIWSKPNCMPESVTDRPTKAHEYVFLLSKSARYFYDAEAIREKSITPAGLTWEQRKEKRPGKNDGVSWRNDVSQAYAGTLGDGIGRNKRTVWTIPTQPYRGAHFAVMPPALVEPMVLAGTSERGCCAACGAAWEQMVEQRGHKYTKKITPKGQVRAEMGLQSARTGLHETGWQDQPPPASITTGWRPTCECGVDDTIPCVILDCFAGAGTTGLVADRLQRDAILIELSPTYAEMMRNRIQGEAPMFVDITMYNSTL